MMFWPSYRCQYERSGRCVVMGGRVCVLKAYGTTSYYSKFSPNALCPRFVSGWRDA